MLLTRGDVAVPFPKYLQNELEAREETSDQQGSRVVLGHLDSRGRRVRSRRSGLRSSGRGNLPASSRRSCSQSGGHRRAAGGRSRRSRSSIAGGVLGTALGLLLALVLAVQVVGVVLNALAEVGLADKVGQRLGVLSRVGDRAVRADTREAQRVRIACVHVSNSTADLRAEVTLAGTPGSFLSGRDLARVETSRQSVVGLGGNAGREGRDHQDY